MSFDPYANWLGIPQDRRPPTLYQLLGLDLFESDPVAIDRAARRQISTVRQHQIGPHSERSRQIVSELAGARLILGDPDRRAAYDAKLRGARAEFPANASTYGEDRPVAKGPSPVPAEPQAEILGSIRLSEEDSPGSASLQPDEDPPALAWSRGAFATFLLTVSAALGVYGYHYAYGTRPPEGAALAAVKFDPAARPPVTKDKRNVRPLSVPPRMPNRTPAGRPAIASATPREGSRENGDPPAKAVRTDEPKPAAKTPGKTPDQRNREAGPSADEQLASVGLERFGQFSLLKQENEAFQKCRDAQATIVSYGENVAKKQNIDAMRQRAASLDRESNNLRIMIDELNLEMEHMPRYNNVEKALYAQALQQRDAMRAQKIADEAEAAQIRSQLPGPQAIHDLDDAIKRGYQACVASLGELRDLIDSIKSKYDKLAHDRVVRNALSELRLKRGPSARFNDVARETTRLERLLQYAR